MKKQLILAGLLALAAFRQAEAQNASEYNDNASIGFNGAITVRVLATRL